MTLPNEFTYLCELVKTNAAIALDAQRQYLMEAKLSPIAQQEGFASVTELIDHLRRQTATELRWKVVEAMTTNETSFFRDMRPFDALRKVIIPQLMQARRNERKLTIWCAACSSGQEPYSLCMLLREYFPSLQTWNLQILASDISTHILQKAELGVYSQLEVNRGLPAPLLVKHFKKVETGWQLNEDIRKMVRFRRINLSTTFPPLPLVDIVMLRNVMIYFSVDTKKTILKNMRQVLRPDGYLFLGTAETTINLDTSYRNETYENICYYRPALPQ